MTRRDFLPGVAPEPCSPLIVADSQRAVRKARFRAAVRDAGQAFLLAGVDYFFVHFPHTHVPLFDRSTSVVILAALNAIVISHIALSRLVPRMTAKRIAATWSLRERARFFQAGWR